MTVMESQKLGFAIFVALSFQVAQTGAQDHPRSTTTTNTTAKPTVATIDNSANTTNTISANTTNTISSNTTNTISDGSHFVGNMSAPIRARSLQEMAVVGSNPSATGLSEGRGRRKKKKKIKIKNPSMNMMIAGSMMAAFVVILTFLNMITVTIGKALFFTFIAKFLISVNWKSSESSTKKKSFRNDITVVMT